MANPLSADDFEAAGISPCPARKPGPFAIKVISGESAVMIKSSENAVGLESRIGGSNLISRPGFRPFMWDFMCGFRGKFAKIA
jgi:hypothetical protein